jgi:uncharacterized oxidoreductase
VPRESDGKNCGTVSLCVRQNMNMELASNSVLITGGATGIGLALARRFLDAGSDVLVCGRRERALREAQASNPALKVLVCDVSREDDRARLRDWALEESPRLNVLVNNAGIQNRTQLTEGGDWTRMREELAINLEAPLHLSALLLPHLRTQPRPVIVNVTSGLAFVPMAAAPVYCATKAALHSFTLSLRHQLSGMVDVVELIPPAVNTDLGGPGLHTFGVALEEFADAAFAGLRNGDVEIAYGMSAKASRASREELDATFARMNQPVS